MEETRREEILEAALRVFAERGFRGTSIDAVAERAGLTRQGVLHYFPSKKKLFMALLRFREKLNREHLEGHDDKDDWPGMLAAAVAYDHTYPCLAQVHSVMLAEGVTGAAPAQQYLHDHYETMQALMIAQLTERYGERLPSGLSPRAAARAMLAMLDGMQQQWLLDGEQDDYPEIMRDVLSVLLGSTPV
ncbi:MULTISPECIES: TetR/AcrR family transcriptional regulator [Streptomyces]|jgi:AcrR family transcriptional regulator|uniref:TetR/AcrR family transcriptional regulator n=1 Tax=Streptomyces mirabilis TaxID=68239 RepID=A0ABU3V1N2_9ACTN|nr:MULTISPECIES: TetR/AcrR family transcriptional regulator [Streptomyces]KPI02247.1 transcriptional regulator, TetR family [Actinobacteria bacterium OK006]MCX4614807.1 TetR/AcrR family transcriptional regulator [Streptomyces mirabilis]MCX5346522.1 TetR/AcrR family transcriptional regulator [Streptomyces mirabilis]MDU9000081.1 TetR/AcrR family transcriptional regulator [Streptomyces mirabilis]NMI55616.1 TetR/AcrR family transcriptional regulator [Streptomyces sp. RLA2-12]